MEPKCCDRSHVPKHWHVVFEREGRLFRWSVAQDPRNVEGGELFGTYQPRLLGRDFLNACVVETHDGAIEFFEGRVFDQFHEDGVPATIEGLPVYLASLTAAQFVRSVRSRWSSEVEARETALRNAYDQRGMKARELFEQLLVDVRRVVLARKRYPEAVQRIEQLPQLFIGG
ncbi:hypothetical protein OG369_39195 [Streptomyces sp. NBC_01221]|uniref:hypothetical protein n=1 Tax=Streptomyces sp. NBC_01221 TaxID=2903782 RepID=UPI00224E789B|nr:hypothetical protein [Streptomyces sp. NBC_01221]MCX4791886.1 hypothetical protein [Streptomyces sp. NBC_01221]